MKSLVLVFVQFAAIFIMLLPLGRPVSNLGFGILLIVLGLGIGFAALAQNKLGNFNIRPVIKEDCKLATNGVYAYVRHPMYSSVLLSMLGILLLYPFEWMLITYVILTINIVLKLLYEESLWKCHSAEYEKYTSTTYRLIPKIF